MEFMFAQDNIEWKSREYNAIRTHIRHDRMGKFSSPLQGQANAEKQPASDWIINRG
jgi:hypothetical protein